MEAIERIFSRVDSCGNIIYINDAFEKASGYKTLEIIGKPHSLLVHPDMPLIILNKLEDALSKNENYRAITKNISNSGICFWLMSEYTKEIDEDGNHDGYLGTKIPVSEEIVAIIEPFYKLLLDIERSSGIEASERYFHMYLKEEYNKNYDNFILDLIKGSYTINDPRKPENGNLINRLFSVF